MNTVRTGEGVTTVSTRSARDDADALVDDAFGDGDIEDPDFAIVFTSSHTDITAFADQIDERLSVHDCEWVGCTTAGEISKAGSTNNSAVMMVIESDAIEFTVATAENVYEDAEAAGRQAATALDGALDDAPYGAVFALIAGITMEEPGQDFEVLRGVLHAFSDDVPVVGGSAGDDLEMNGTYQFHNGEVFEDAVVLTAIASELPIRTGEAHGMEESIASGVINETDGRVINTVSGRPAAAFYADAIGVSVQDLTTHFDTQYGKQIRLGLRYLWLRLRGHDPVKVSRVAQYALDNALMVPAGHDENRAVYPMGVTEDWGLIMASPVEENQLLYVMETDRANIVAAAKDAFAGIDETPLFGVVNDCTCRNQLLSDDELDLEVELLREQLSCPVIGFYGYGEIGGQGGYTTYRNQTVSGFVITDPSADRRDEDT